MLVPFLFLLCLHKPSMHPALRPALSSSLLLSAWVVRVTPIPLGPHLGAHPGQGAEGLVGLLVGGLLQLLQPGQPTLFF